MNGVHVQVPAVTVDFGKNEGRKEVHNRGREDTSVRPG